MCNVDKNPEYGKVHEDTAQANQPESDEPAHTGRAGHEGDKASQKTALLPISFGISLTHKGLMVVTLGGDVKEDATEDRTSITKCRGHHVCSGAPR